METFTTLRLRNTIGETGGEWFADKITDYHRKSLSEFQRGEPAADWRLETRGLSATWHKVSP